eukprot:8107269-Alexandrium_andersonii.AAC.1
MLLVCRRVPDAAAGDLAFGPRAAREVMEAAGPALTQDVADLSAWPLRIVLGQLQEWFLKVDRGAAIAVTG